MPWYLITINLRDGSKRTGARWMDFVDPENVRKRIWSQANEKIGRMNIDNIQWEEVNTDHPLVWAAQMRKSKENEEKERKGRR
jgi:hypothetical protein